MNRSERRSVLTKARWNYFRELVNDYMEEKDVISAEEEATLFNNFLRLASVGDRGNEMLRGFWDLSKDSLDHFFENHDVLEGGDRQKIKRITTQNLEFLKDDDFDGEDSIYADEDETEEMPAASDAEEETASTEEILEEEIVPVEESVVVETSAEEMPLESMEVASSVEEEMSLESVESTATSMEEEMLSEISGEQPLDHTEL